MKPPYAPDFAAQLAAVESIRPKAFTSHLAALPPDWLQEIPGGRASLIGGSATNIAEAKELESLGVDFIIAQGSEAGGHRGTWLRDPYDALTGTLALTRLIVRAVRVPVVAAGGIMDGAGIAAVLALGAQAAQLGTAFIPCPESGASQVHKQALLAALEDDTRITEKFSGKPARGLVNRFIARNGAGAAASPFRPRTASPGSCARPPPRRAGPIASRCGPARLLRSRARSRRRS